MLFQPIVSFTKTTLRLIQLVIQSINLASHPKYAQVLAPVSISTLADSTDCSLEKYFTEKVYVWMEVKAYFEGIEVSHYRTGFEILEDHYIKCITPDGDCVRE